MTTDITLAADNHVHTEWSWDASTGAMLESCAMAVKLGLPAIAFTDHADFTDWTFPGAGRKDTPVTRVIDTHAASGLLDLDGYLTSLDRCRIAYPQLRILSGVELGESHIFIDESTDLIARAGGFDRVLGSLHSLAVGGRLHYAPTLMTPDGAPAVMRAYLAETYEMIEKSPLFGILAHLDYPMRAWPKAAEPFRVNDYEDEYRTVLRALAGSGRVLEVNTAGPWPAGEVVRWWYLEGGQAVSFGSDAHEPATIAKDFPQAAAMVEACGFRSGREPADFWRR
jgi:histidinol-phosphatase (PHP family)